MYIKTNGQAGVFVDSRWHIVTRSVLPIVTQLLLWPEYNRLYEPWIRFTGHCQHRLRGSFFFGRRRRKKWRRNISGRVEIQECAQLVFWSNRRKFSLQSLQKKTHLLEHDKHLATALWLMGRKTEVTSVHFQRCLIYSHFAVFHSFTVGKDPTSLPGV